MVHSKNIILVKKFVKGKIGNENFSSYLAQRDS